MKREVRISKLKELADKMRASMTATGGSDSVTIREWMRLLTKPMNEYRRSLQAARRCSTLAVINDGADAAIYEQR